MEPKIGLEAYKALIDDAFRNTPLNLRQNKAAVILSEAHKHFTRKEFQEIQELELILSNKADVVTGSSFYELFVLTLLGGGSATRER